MAFPLLKLFFAGYKYASKPLNSLLIRAFKTRGRDSYIRFWFEKFGQFVHKTEVKINRNFVQGNKSDTMTHKDDDEKLELYIKPLNSESAFNKGVEYGIEFIILYGSLFFITAYEIKKNYEKSNTEKREKIKL